MTDNLWFPPLNVIHHFRELERQGKLVPGSKIYRKAAEGYIVAISLMGVMKILGREFWMQLVSDDEGSPDVRTGCYDKKIRDNDFSVQDVEVVTFDEHASEDNLIDFLMNTKLARKKSYDDQTTILCHVHRPTWVPPYAELQASLANKHLTTKAPVIVIGRSDPTKEIYKMAQIYPAVDLVTSFDLIEECHKHPKRHILRLRRSGKPTIEVVSNPKEKHYPFEKLGVV